MKKPVTIRRFPSGVPCLDSVFGGGLLEFSFNIIAGAPGSGKAGVRLPNAELIRLISRSNCPGAPKMWKMRRPPRVVVWCRWLRSKSKIQSRQYNARFISIR